MRGLPVCFFFFALLNHLDVVGGEEALAALAGALPPSLVVLAGDGNDVAGIERELVGLGGCVCVQGLALGQIGLGRGGSGTARACTWRARGGAAACSDSTGWCRVAASGCRSLWCRCSCRTRRWPSSKASRCSTGACASKTTRGSRAGGTRCLLLLRGLVGLLLLWRGLVCLLLLLLLLRRGAAVSAGGTTRLLRGRLLERGGRCGLHVARVLGHTLWDEHRAVLHRRRLDLVVALELDCTLLPLFDEVLDAAPTKRSIYKYINNLKDILVSEEKTKVAAALLLLLLDEGDELGLEDRLKDLVIVGGHVQADIVVGECAHGH